MITKNVWKRVLALVLTLVTLLSATALPMSAYADDSASTELTQAVDDGSEASDDVQEATDSSEAQTSALSLTEEALEAETEPETEAETEATYETSEDTEAEESASNTVSTDGAVELTTEEFEAEIEQSESQETVDEETGLTLATVLEAASEEGISLADLEVGESVFFSVSVVDDSLDADEEDESAIAVTSLEEDESETEEEAEEAETSSTTSVTITRGSWYYYSDYGLGTFRTAPYYVSYGSITATAYCVQPSKDGPDDGTYTITKLSDSKTLAKVCYYGTLASGDEGFFEENYPDFSTGKRFVITHLAAAYANGSSDAFSGANSTAQALALELYEYCLSQPDIPDVAMSFSNSDVTAYVSGTEQRTEEVTFQADELQTVT
ncbi:MAG: Cna protein B-type domain protein, partial [Lachnospiraceae bacterium]|nr:Cna protein B-type domain protein [Lachnospiraceae bacterium]